PPWLQEQVARLQQLQQNLQSILLQKQHLESEQLETERALEVLKKASDDETVYKSAGSILIKSTKASLILELEEKKELANTRLVVLEKQETRINENLKEAERKSVHDFISSVSDGRLFDQCNRLKEHFEHPTIVIEGNVDEIDQIAENPLIFYGAMSSVVLDFKIPVIPTPNASHTAKLLI